MQTKAVDWTDLPYFLAISRTGSLRAAAQLLGATHATVNRRISNLEHTYGVQLFDRSVDGLTLTAAGEELLPLAIQAEEAIFAGRRKLSGLDGKPQGNVRLSIPPVFADEILGPLLAEFMATYPEIELEIVTTNRMQDLARHEIDVSVRIAYNVEDNVVGRKIVTYAMGLYANQGYIDRYLPTAGPKGEGLTFLGWGDTTDRPQWLLKSPFPKATLRHTARDAFMQLGLVKAGAGLSYLPCFAAALNPDLIEVPNTEPYLDRSIWVLLHSDLRKTKRVRLLVDHLSNGLRKQKALFMGPLA